MAELASGLEIRSLGMSVTAGRSERDLGSSELVTRGTKRCAAGCAARGADNEQGNIQGTIRNISFLFQKSFHHSFPALALGVEQLQRLGDVPTGKDSTPLQVRVGQVISIDAMDSNSSSTSGDLS